MEATMTTEYKDATWASLKDGSWGLRVQAEVTEGEVVKVQTRGGKTTYESVGKIVWVGRNNVTDGSVAYTLATLGPKPEVKKPRAPRKPKASKLPTLEEYAAEIRAEKAADDYVDYEKASDDLPY
jgi:hypothetical protein